MKGWPSDKSIYEHAAYELLKWGNDHKDEYRSQTGKSIDKRSQIIFGSRQGIPEVEEMKREQIEKYGVSVTQGDDIFAKKGRVELKSKKSNHMASNRLELSIFNFNVDSGSLKSQAPPSAQFVAPAQVSRPSSSTIKEQIKNTNKNLDATYGLNDRDSSQAPNDISRISEQKESGDMRAAPER